MATTQVQVYWLVLTQIVLGVLAIFALVVFIASPPVYNMQVQTVGYEGAGGSVYTGDACPGQRKAENR